MGIAIDAVRRAAVAPSGRSGGILGAVRLVTQSLASIACAYFLSACCCCNGDWTPPDRDDASATAAARDYLDQNGSSLRVSSADAGARDGGASGDGCGLGHLAVDVAIAVASRGHAGGNSAAEVTINPGACFKKIVVLVVLTAGVWRGIRAVAYDDRDREVIRIGERTPYVVWETVAAPGEHDFGSDELF